MQNAVFLILAIAAIWFMARFVIGPRRGAPSLGSMFRRERAIVRSGLGKAALATLIEDTRTFVAAEPGLRGIILAGPFAAEAADGGSTVTLVILCEAAEPYSGAAWLERWPYPARGHAVQQHQASAAPSEAAHQLTLRGAPRLAVHFVPIAALEPPADLRAALADGAETLDDPTGLAEKLRLRWLDAVRNARPA